MLILLFLIIILNLFTLIFSSNICSYSYNKNEDLFINISNENIQSIILNDLNYYISNFLSSDKNVYVHKNNNIIISFSSNLLCSKELSYNDNLIYVDLEKCLNLIESNENLIIVQIELERRTEKTNQILYLISDKNGNKINIEKNCKNLYFNITFPFSKSTLLNYDYGKEIFEKYEIDIFNTNIDFYNDICYKFEYNEKDILIEDRRKIIYKNVSFCDENCDYSKIDYKNNRIECNCKFINEEFKEFTKSKFLNNFPKGINKSNLNIFKCNKLIKANIGFIIILILVCLQIPEFLIFFIATKLKDLKLYIINDQKKQKKFKKIEIFEVEAPNEEPYVEDENNNAEFNEEDEEEEEDENSENKENSNKESDSNINTNKESNNSNKETNNNLKKNINNNEFKKNNIVPKSLNENNSNYSNIKYYNPMDFQSIKSNPPKKNKKHSDSSSNESKNSKKNKKNNIKNISDIKTNNLLFQINEPNNKTPIVLNEKDYINRKKNKPLNLNIFDYHPEKKIVEPVKEPSIETQKLEWTKRKKIVVQHKINFTEDQIDAFDFKFALENDSRTFCSLFCHILCNNIFPFSLLSCSPFEPTLIKISFILFIFIVIIGFNAFCYFFKYIHKRFNSNKNKFNFGYCFSNEIDRSLLAGFLSFVMYLMINVSLLKYKLKFENILLKYKIMKEKGYFNEINRLIDRLKITIIIYVVINYIIILIFWIYIMIFCELFKNNINGLFFSSIISFLFIFIYCFIFYAIIAGLRVLSLKKKYETLYNILKFFI